MPKIAYAFHFMIVEIHNFKHIQNISFQMLSQVEIIIKIKYLLLDS